MPINYTAPATCGNFMRSESFGRLIAGPVGSGKTTCMILELLRRALEQEPGDDGLRHTRFAIIRQTLTQLKSTVLKDISQWMAGIYEWRVSDSTVYVTFGKVRSEWLFIPMDQPEDQRRLLSSQLTGAWISEGIEIDVDLIASISGRIGRYPSAGHGAPTWRGILIDTNFPTEGSPWWAFMESPPPTFEIFKQPGGREDNAENLDWLDQTSETLKLLLGHRDRLARGRGYYDRLATNSNVDWIHRYVDAKYGRDPSGSAVFGTSFKKSFHVADELTPVPGRLIIVGQDFGRQPWSIITQLDHKGRLLVLEEVDGTDTGLEQHLRMNLRPALIAERYSQIPICLVGDPAGRAKSSLYETNEFDLLKSMGFSAQPAPTNDLDPRLRAVESMLLGQRDGGAQLIIDGSRCKRLVDGLNGGYKFARAKNGVSKPTPDKNEYSHVCDALQYACLVAGNPGAYGFVYGRIMNVGARRASSDARRVSAKAWT